LFGDCVFDDTLCCQHLDISACRAPEIV